MKNEPDLVKAPTVPAVNCHNCRYSGVDASGRGVVCRKGLPKAAMGMQLNPLTRQPEPGVFALWPPVTNQDWCAEHGVKLAS